MEHLELAYETPMGQLPASMRAAWQQIDGAIASHREVIGPDLTPVEDWDPRPALGSEVESRQLAALWGRIATTIKRACVAVRSNGNLYLLDEEEIPQASSSVGPHAITIVAHAVRPRPGITWLAVTSLDGRPVKAGRDFRSESRSAGGWTTSSSSLHSVLRSAARALTRCCRSLSSVRSPASGEGRTSMRCSCRIPVTRRSRSSTSRRPGRSSRRSERCRFA